MAWQGRRFAALRLRPWWRPFALTAATAAAIATLFNPVPALADPSIPGAVPDTGSRPALTGSVTLPGAQASTGTTAPAALAPSTSTLPTSPILQKVEKGRAEVAAAGEELTALDEELNLVRTQLATADQKVATAQAAIAAAEAEVKASASAAVRDAAAQPPGSFGGGLSDLSSLADIQRGNSDTLEAATRRLTNAKADLATAQADQQTFAARLAELTATRATKQTAFTKKQAAQQKLETDNAPAIAAAEAAESAADAALSGQYLSGAQAGQGADPRAVAALQIALAQRGIDYVWSEETPGAGFDCSGLMYYSYRSAAAGSYPLTRVSRDQYWQTHQKTVDRYSLLPGDLLFYSYSNSWEDIHHVAMYAGDGMMVEAPRTGLDVRLTPVRWSRLFAATRVYGAVAGGATNPSLPAADPEKPSNHTPATPSPTPNPTKTTKPPTTPSSPTSPSTSPSSPKPPSSPSTSPSSPKPPTSTSPDPEPSETSESPEPEPSETSETPSTEPSEVEESPSSSSSASSSTSTSASAAVSASAAAAAEAKNSAS